MINDFILESSLFIDIKVDYRILNYIYCDRSKVIAMTDNNMTITKEIRMITMYFIFMSPDFSI